MTGRPAALRYGLPARYETLVTNVGEAREGPEGSERECGRPAP